MTALAHGRYTTYSNGRCRCGQCRDAFNAYMREWRTHQRELGIPPGVSHGNYSTYTNYLCRCRSCRDAWAAYKRELYARRRAS